MRAHALVLRLLGALVLPSAVGVIFAEAQACNPACTGPEREFTGGETKRATDVLVYETSPITGPFLPFEGATDLHVRHGLGVAPTRVDVYLSFNNHPEDNGNGGFAPGAGNQDVVLSSDACEVRIRNDTCADYFVRVVVTAYPGLDPDAGAPVSCDGDAGADAATETDAVTDAGAESDAAADAADATDAETD